MSRVTQTDFTGRLQDVAAALLKLGATAYGGPAIMGVMQAELQEKRRWVSKERFLEGLSVANMLPGATATQLGIFLGYARGGWWGGLVAGLCFVLPVFVVMLALTIAYASVSVTPLARSALYGLGPVVLGLFAVAVYRLGRSVAGTVPEAVIGVLAAAAFAGTPVGIVAILLLSGGAGVLLFHPKKPRASVLVLASMAFLGVLSLVWWMTRSGPHAPVAGHVPDPNSLLEVGSYFFKVGAFTIGGGLTMIAFIQEQVVGQFGWLTPREFIDGLALGQFTPGPNLMIAGAILGVLRSRLPAVAGFKAMGRLIISSRVT